MGCGKTTVGRELTAKLHFGFADLDDIIAERAGMPVSDIFSRYGEGFFRSLERAAASELSAAGNLVIAVGGGAVLEPENVLRFKSGGVLVFLDVPLNVIIRRLSGDHSRPLLERPDRENTMRELYAHRLPIYRGVADYTADLGDLPACAAADLILGLPGLLPGLGAR